MTPAASWGVPASFLYAQLSKLDARCLACSGLTSTLGGDLQMVIEGHSHPVAFCHNTGPCVRELNRICHLKNLGSPVWSTACIAGACVCAAERGLKRSPKWSRRFLASLPLLAGYCTATNCALCRDARFGGFTWHISVLHCGSPLVELKVGTTFKLRFLKLIFFFNLRVFIKE